MLFDDGRDRSWMDDAACANHPQPDLWYPDNTNVYSLEAREAATICSTCPVRIQCYEFGCKERYGIYGGVLMSNRQRIPPLPKYMDEPQHRAPHQPPPRKRVPPRPKVVAVVEPAPKLEPVQRERHPAAAAAAVEPPTTVLPVEEELVVAIVDAPEPEQPEEPEGIVTPIPQDRGNPITVAVNAVKRWLRL